ncbi:restriction endonuclease subunit S [Alloprevotella tannerae]|uniref:restriction endonuclease subunit S n=1 Tax=Alloprevotella tannerae TaxID=76122 RepID=UPI001EDC1830|nr:restriction endonuclease subunit S [Alloprevotella tannerae]MCG2653634.1 restriction endonuclease subunit S [Alloprevotella tannerae]
MIETRFKDTEVGRISEEWQLDRLKENFEFKTNNTLSRDTLSDSGIIQDVHYGDVLVKYGSHLDVQKDDVPYISDDGFRASSFISDGDVIIADTAEDETVGKATEVLNVGNNKLVSGLHTMWLHPINQEKYALGYLGYAFNASIYHNQLLPLMQGTKVTSVSKSAIKDTYIVVPSKSEQTRIATALSNVDALISELDKLIEKKRAIKQGAMQQLLTGKKRLKGFSEPWVEKKLGEDATILRGGSPRPIEDYITDSQDGLNWIKIGDVKPEDKYLRKTAEKIKKEGLSKTRQVKKGDFILSNSMSFGRPYILDIDGCIHDGWLVIQDYQEAYDMQFLYYILCSDAIMNQYVSMAAGSSVQNLNKEKVTNVLLYAPTSLQEQSAIASVLTSMDNEISALEAKEAKYEQIKQGMMQQLLTGKIRLVETAAKTNTTSANVHFRRSVLAAEIAERLYEEPTFGHVKMEKMLFLTERLCHIDIGSHYHRDAAGPYDNRALRSIDSQLKKQKWFEVRRIEKGNRYVPMQNCGKHKTYFDKYFSAVLPTFDKIIETFKTQNTERCEIVATLYSAWEDLLHSNKSFTDADIVNEVLNNWHESKKRISQDRWLSAIQWMRENGFAPNV